MKKEIRIYFNLEKEADKKAYEFLKSKRSASSFLIDKLNSEVNIADENFNILLASKLQLIADALNKIDTFKINTNIAPDAADVTDEETVKLILNDEFDDDY